MFSVSILLALPAVICGGAVVGALPFVVLPKRFAGVFVVCAAVFLLLTVFYLFADFFTANGIDESVWFHLRYGLDGQIIRQFFPYVLGFFASIFTVFIYCYWCFLRQRRGVKGPLWLGVLLGVLIYASLASHPAFKDIWSLVSNRVSSADIELVDIPLDYPRLPDQVEGKSFVYLYVESLESLFWDGNGSISQIRHSRQWLDKGLRIRGIHQAPMTGWTIAGMVASQCGVTLSTYGERNNTLNIMPSFLPGAVCLGDILVQQGYQLSYLGGASLSFAGKGAFYRGHGFREVIGKEQLLARMGRVPTSKWGIYDQYLYPELLRLIERKAQGAQPFGVIALTLDTHPPKGESSPMCSQLPLVSTKSSMLAAVNCADHQLNHFIQKFMASPYTRDVILILSSDHLMMGNDAGIRSSIKERDNFMLILNGPSPGEVHREATMMDVAPTLLHLLGFSVNAWGLGRNLLLDEPTLAEVMGRDELYDSLSKWRYALWQLWDGEGGVIMGSRD